MKVSFVVESDRAKGLGHLSRMRVLAEALTEKGATCRFFLTRANDAVPATLLADEEPPPDEIVVVDGIWFDDALLARLKTSARRFVLIDDLADRPFPADIVLNQNIYARNLDYSAYGAGQLLLGPEYVLIRQDFFALREVPVPTSSHILVTLGGGVTAGFGDEVAKALSAAGLTSVSIARGRDDLVALMREASLVICGLGVTFLEALASNRLVIGVQLADNQRLAFTAARRRSLTVFETLNAPAIASAAQTLIASASINPASQSELFSLGGPTRAARALLEGLK